MALDEALRAVLVCPRCKGELTYETESRRPWSAGPAACATGSRTTSP